MSTVASHIGMASPMFKESCVVGVKVYGRRPSKLIINSMVINDVRIMDHWWPVLLIGSISCFVNELIVHDWSVERRLVNHRVFWVGKRVDGISRARVVNGIPRICGLMNWSKNVRFMVRFRGLCWFYCFCWLGYL